MFRLPMMFAAFVVAVWCSSCGAADNERASEKQQARAILSSEKVVLNDALYMLEADGSRLILVTQSLEGDRKISREPLDCSASKHGGPVELSLTTMGEKNLLAVAKVRRDQKCDFYCLTFIGPRSNDLPTAPFRMYESKFYSASRDLKVLAISGKHAAGSALVILGEIPRPEHPANVVIYFCGCPWPPTDGQLLTYQAHESDGD